MSVMVSTPDGIAFARLAALKGVLDMQARFGADAARAFARTTGTAVAKRDYGFKGAAAAFLPVVEQEIADIYVIRQWAPEAVASVAAELDRLKDLLEAQGDEFTHEQVAASVADANMPEDEAQFILAVDRVRRFEAQATSTAIKVVFR